MAMINHYTGIGRLTAAAELNYTGAGSAVMKFSICINESYKKDGDWVEKPNFFNCVVWGKYAEAMQKHMTKGKRVGIEGKLQQNTWEDNKGSRHNDVSIVVSNIALLDSPKGDSNNGNKAEHAGGDHPADEVPF